MDLCDIVVITICVIGFAIHTTINIVKDMNTKRTEAEVTYQDINKIEMPIVMIISISPSFHIDQVVKNGYPQPFYYFQGTDELGNPIGWRGKQQSNESLKTVEGRSSIDNFG